MTKGIELHQHTVPFDLHHLQDRSTFVRRHIIDGAAAGGSGHLGPAMSCVEIIVSLYYGYLRIDPEDPHWAKRDRFVMGKGHGCAALYPVLADVGFFSKDELETFSQLGSSLADHPNMNKNPGVDFSSGSLGHALAIVAGMAEAARLQDFDSRSVALLGDGELNEGQIWEAAAYAASKRLGSVLAIVDRNEVQVDGRTDEVLPFGSIAAKFEAFGWAVETIDGHDLTAIHDALERFDTRRRQPDAPPTALIAQTVAGKGIRFIEGLAEWHVGYLAGEDYDRAMNDVNAMYETRTA
ncbi:MAG: transketolase [Candidatus Microbacterium stercoravium]